MKCRVATVNHFKSAIRFGCAELCNPESGMQHEFSGGSRTKVAVVFAEKKLPVAWAATHVWRGMQTLEGYTHKWHRRRGLQRFAATGLIAAGMLDTTKPVAVFSPDCVGLTRSLGFVDVKLFRRTGSSDWIEVPE